MVGKRDLTGMRVGRLVVEGEVVYKGRYKWQCACDCGGKTWLYAQNFVSGRTKSCGCIAKEISKNAISKRPEYQAWRAINEQAKTGIYIDPRWLESFDAFVADVGERPSKGHRLTRRVPAEGYTKDNCYWKAPKHGN